MPRFPLLHLPTLPLLNCIQYLKVFEIIDFSLLSKRTKALVSLVNWNQPDIHLYFIEDSQICLKFPNDPGLEWILDFENEFDDELNHTSRAIDGNQFPSSISSALHGPKVFHYLNIDRKFRNTSTKRSVDNVNCKMVHSRVLILEESDLTLHDMNTLLKCWLNGSNPQLEYISIRRSIKEKKMEENAFQIVTKDLEFREHVEDGKRPMQILCAHLVPASTSVLEQLSTRKEIDLEFLEEMLEKAFIQYKEVEHELPEKDVEEDQAIPESSPSSST
ncbi:hypothetical protein GCK72_012765 [Caenorhabditis remanei]|uniref:F-box domain-containing protein n=1 Tax=Caenorhabditis remanei TaxID=31234 RepID=A0A6A5GPG3_CAERE|nr:hypothetical protein GCK72_012765 [Caenorhabditis remanei]KAF1756312.1 hypothetical protein GCK72_012765 [Caenorhabditis remanei]